eukprot:EG_transcript_17941
MSGKWTPKVLHKNAMPADYKSKEELEEERDVVEIKDNLYLSGLLGTNATDHLHSLGITHILTLGMEGPLSSSSHFTYRCIKKEDLCYEDLLSSFEEAIEFINSSHKCLIHCHKGVSRSPTIIVAYLMSQQNISLDVALAAVRQRRPVVSPNYGFLRQLRLFQAMGCHLSGPLYRWYMQEVAGCQGIHPDVFTTNPGMSVDPSVYLRALEADCFGSGGVFQPDGVYGCGECQRVLFTPIHVLCVEGPRVAVEKIQWMTSMSHNGQACCPNGHELGLLQEHRAVLEVAKLVLLHSVVESAHSNGCS